MTTNQQQDQDEHRGRAVWLARLPSGQSQTQERYQDRRARASKLARSHGAGVTGEFLISSGEDEHMPEHVWGEVLDFLQHLQADLLVVIRPDEIASSFADYYRRTETLERVGVRLVIWAVDGHVRTLEEPTAA